MDLLTITGPPGTGKTTTISKLIRRYVEEEGVDRRRILVASLTRAAAREAARVVSLPDRQVGTWHSFAYHALGEPELTESHLKEWNEQFDARWRLSSARDGGRESPLLGGADTWNVGDKLMLRYSTLRAQGIDYKTAINTELNEFGDAWEDWKRQCGYSDFSDLIENALDVERAPGDPAVILCDEEQDISYAEARLIAHWGRHAQRLVLAGDPHQAIYGWRGSDPVAVQEVWDTLRPERREAQVLHQSYRLSKAVHAVALLQMDRCRGLKAVRYAPTDVPGECYSAPAFVNGDAVDDALANARPGETIMFLASCGYMLKDVMRELASRGEPWHNPWRLAAPTWNPFFVSKGTSFRDRCLAFMRPSTEVWGDEARFWSVGDVKAWAHALPVKGVFVPKAKAEIASLKEAMRPQDLAAALNRWLLPEALERVTSFDLKWFLRLAPQVERQAGARLAANVVNMKGAAALAQEPRVIVGTIHSLKGSEADVVYVCPDISLAALREASTDSRVQAELERVFYVAVTRAKRALALCRPGSNLHVAL